MEPKANISTRWKNFEPTKKFVFWACTASVGVTVLVGFNWGGWVTGGTARSMAEDAAAQARIEIAVDSCVARFNQGTAASERLAKLKKTHEWMRGDHMEKGGWATPVGAEDPIAGAGARCAKRLLTTQTTAAKTTN